MYSEKDCFLLLLGCEDLELGFGFDLRVFRTGENFFGIQKIPKNETHLVYYFLMKSGETKPTPRSFFFLHFDNHWLEVKKFDQNSEVFRRVEDKNELREYETRLRRGEYVNKLAPYSEDLNFRNLTPHLNLEVLKKVSPVDDGETRFFSKIPKIKESSS